MPWTNYHSHTHYCDGANPPEDYIKSAIKNKLYAYGYSAHAPVNFDTDWCVADEKFAEYMSVVKLIKDKYAQQIQTYIGLEIDYIPDISGRNKHVIANSPLDYFIGSIHFTDRFSDGTHWNIDHNKEIFHKGIEDIFNGDFRKAATRFFELSVQMIDEEKPDIIGHLDKIKMFNTNNCYFNETDSWYKELVFMLLKRLKNSNTIAEINTRGYYKYGQPDLYPSQWIIEKMVEMDIPMMLNSDSHAPNEVTSGFEYAAAELKKFGVKQLWILLDNKWQAKEFSEKGLVM